VANYVETEVLVWTPTATFAHVQLRGSVPLFWEQTGLQLTSHRITITRPQAATRPALSRHVKGEISRYKRLHILNLLSHKGDEKVLADAYRDQISSTGISVGWSELDFNKEVAKEDGLDWIKQLVIHGEIGHLVTEYGFWGITGDGSVVTKQSGVIRSNCLDCLDRTNVMQSFIAQHALGALIFAQLPKSFYTLFQQAHQRHANLWAENGDALSHMYAGTGALKSSLTRSGTIGAANSTTWKSLLGDVQKSIGRMVQGIVSDGEKQETVDLLMGKMYYQREILFQDTIRDAVRVQLQRRLKDYAKKESVRFHVGTFNVGGQIPDVSLKPWLQAGEGQKAADVYVLGIQELVELTASQIVNVDSSQRALWENYILEALNADDPYYEDGNYVLIRSGQLVGTALMVFAHVKEAPRIKNVEIATKKTGLSGMTGNKGGVAIRFDWNESSFCFISAHFAAGQANVVDRNTDYQTILEGIVFSRGRQIDDHETVVWLGDFNYRIDLDNDHVRNHVDQMDIFKLLEHDQLLREHKGGYTFDGLKEGQITFPPTYKYDIGTNVYDTSEKARTPSWCDRILYKGPHVLQRGYATVGLTFSDHRPVFAIFDTTIISIDKRAKDNLYTELLHDYGIDRRSMFKHKSEPPPPIARKPSVRTSSLPQPRSPLPPPSLVVMADKPTPPPIPTKPKPKLSIAEKPVLPAANPFDQPLDLQSDSEEDTPQETKPPPIPPRKSKAQI
jgi:hypothetical protein